jgi:hypothetical protein
MSELIGQQHRDFRRQLLISVSALSLLASVAAISEAAAEEPSRPAVWIELGGQLQRVDGAPDPYAPSMVAAFPALDFTSPIVVQRPARYSIGGDGKISFAPGNDGWIFSAAISYGRSNSARHVHEQTPASPIHETIGTFHLSVEPTKARFGDTVFAQSENHAIVDFQAGKDVGLGGANSSSLLSLGVRFAQLNSRSRVEIHSQPNYELDFLHAKYYDLYEAAAVVARSFRGIGPSVSWSGSTTVLGNPGKGELSLDWGLSGALLFGRQKVTGNHRTSDEGHCKNGVLGTACDAEAFPTVTHAGYSRTNYSENSAPIRRGHSVTVPNLNLLAGLSYRVENFKVSAGYRADFFFGAVDGGIDTRKTYDRNFYGPFATISIGLGG